MNYSKILPDVYSKLQSIYPGNNINMTIDKIWYVSYSHTTFLADYSDMRLSYKIKVWQMLSTVGDEFLR